MCHFIESIVKNEAVFVSIYGCPLFLSIRIKSYKPESHRLHYTVHIKIGNE
jgi:hypothetical protein